jgi:hypothetical protein
MRKKKLFLSTLVKQSANGLRFSAEKGGRKVAEARAW